MKEARPALSIVIVNFETADYTLGSIRSILENPPQLSFEIIVIDNGSKDGSLECIRGEVPEVTCIETGHNLGFGRANNLGVANALGEFVLLLNSDTRVVDNSIQRMLDHLIAHPEIGAVGPRQIDGRGRLQLSWGAFPTLVSEIYRKIVYYRLSLNDLRIRDYLEEKYAVNTKVDWISGSCLMARKETLCGAGLFDEYFFMYFEDIDLCRRIRDEGWGIEYHPEMTIIHYGGISAMKNILRVLVEYRRSQIYFARKYYGKSGVLVLRVLLLLKYGAHFARSFLVLANGKLSAKKRPEVFSELLVAKKTIELALGKKPYDIGTS